MLEVETQISPATLVSQGLGEADLNAVLSVSQARTNSKDTICDTPIPETPRASAPPKSDPGFSDDNSTEVVSSEDDTDEEGGEEELSKMNDLNTVDICVSSTPPLGTSKQQDRGGIFRPKGRVRDGTSSGSKSKPTKPGSKSDTSKKPKDPTKPADDKAKENPERKDKKDSESS